MCLTCHANLQVLTGEMLCNRSVCLAPCSLVYTKTQAIGLNVAGRFITVTEQSFLFSRDISEMFTIELCALYNAFGRNMKSQFTGLAHRLYKIIDVGIMTPATGLWTVILKLRVWQFACHHLGFLGPQVTMFG